MDYVSEAIDCEVPVVFAKTHHRSGSMLWDMACGYIPPPEPRHGLQAMRTVSIDCPPPPRPIFASGNAFHEVLNSQFSFLGYCHLCHRRKVDFGSGIGYCPSSICRRRAKEMRQSTIRRMPAPSSGSVVKAITSQHRRFP